MEKANHKGNAMNAQLATTDAVSNFILAGNATFTVVSKKTGNRRTFKMQQTEDGRGYFCKLLAGPDNVNSYRYLGFAYQKQGGWIVKSNKEGWAPDAVQAIYWVVSHLSSPALLEQAEVWHEGRCGKCGRVLTVPESIASGIGPICAQGGRD